MKNYHTQFSLIDHKEELQWLNGNMSTKAYIAKFQKKLDTALAESNENYKELALINRGIVITDEDVEKLIQAAY